MLNAKPHPGLFCARPFVFATVDVSGNVNLCCQGWLPRSAGNLQDNTFDEIWNSAEAQEIRRSIHDGSFRYCIADCPFLVERNYGLLTRKEDIQDPFLKRVAEQELTVLDRGPVEFLPAYDATCNIACPSCRDRTIVYTGEQKQFAQSLHDVVMAQVGKNIQLLVLSGQGDPFASPIYRDILRNSDQRLNPDYKLGLITNALLFDEDFWQSMGPTRQRVLFFHVSTNAASPETFHKIQGGGDFARFRRNLEYIGQLRKRGEVPFLRMAFYVTAQNFREMIPYIHLAREVGADEAEFALLLYVGTYSEGRHDELAVHDTRHPDHAEFLSILKDPIFDEPFVVLGNLRMFRSTPA